MAQQLIGIGAVPNDGTGDSIRDAFDKTNDNFTELYTELAAKQTMLHPGFVAGNWYNANGPIDVGTGSAIGANSVKLLPFILARPMTVSDLGVQIETLSAGGNVRAAIYASDPVTHLPTTVLAETGNISTAATGHLSADITGANVLLAAGALYWQAVIADNAVVALKSQLNSTNLTGYYLGSPTLATAASTTGSGRFSKTFASAFGAFPDLTGQVLADVGAGYGIIFLKAA